MIISLHKDKYFIASLLLSILIVSDIFTMTDMNIATYRQWGNNTCWAATCKMILDAYKYPKTETDIRNWAFPPNGQDVKNEIYGTTISCDRVLENFSAYYIHVNYGYFDQWNSYLTKGEIITEINARRPILTGWRDLFLLAGHMVLIRGFTGSGLLGDLGNVIFNNPSDGLRTVQSYEWFCQHTTTNPDHIWNFTDWLKMTVGAKDPIPLGDGPNELVKIESGTYTITQSPQSLTYTAKKYGAHVPIRWKWQLVFVSTTGDCVVASWTNTNSNFASTWNIPNFTLPLGYQWVYNFDGKIPGRIELIVDDNAGQPSHEHALTVIYTPQSLYSGYLIYENKTISNSQPDVKAHQRIFALNDKFNSGGNISLRAGEAINIGDGITVRNGSVVNFKIEPPLR